MSILQDEGVFLERYSEAGPGGSAGHPYLAEPHPLAEPPSGVRHRLPSEPPGPLREVVDLDVGVHISVRELAGVRFDYPWHAHPEVELVLITSGQGMRHVGDSIEPFGPGDLVLVGRETPHCWLSSPGGERTDGALLVQFSPDVFGRGFLALLETRPIAGLLERAARGLVFGGEVRDAAERQLRLLARPELSGAEKLTLLITVLSTLAAGGGGRPLALMAPEGPPEGSRMGAVVRYLHQHSAERLSRSALARRAGMSSGTFSRFFTRQFGKPFVTYVAELRIGNACRLLRERDTNVSDVAYEVGFHNLANFNRTFLRLKGMTPSAYRRLARSRSAAPSYG